MGGSDRKRMKDAARLAMLEALLRGKTLPGDAVRRAFGGLDAAVDAVFAIMDEHAAAEHVTAALDFKELANRALSQSQQRDNAYVVAMPQI